MSRADRGAKQWTARQAVLNNPLFPDLERILFATFGPTAEAIMLHQLCYWFSKEKMQDRRSLYLTYADWREQRGLNRKQVDKGRARLKPTGIVEETYGNYKRLHYTLDWVRLAERLAIETPEGGTVATATLEGGTVETGAPKGGAVQTATPSERITGDDMPHRNGTGGPEEGANRGGQSNAVEDAEEYARAYPAGDFPLQGGADGSPSRDASFEEEVEYPAPAAIENAPHGPTTPREVPPPPEFSPEEKNNAWAEMVGLRGDGEVMRLCEQNRAGEPVSVEQIARKIIEQIGGGGSIESHAAWVSYCLEGEAQGVNAR